ncbi:MAG: ABC transporter substrate-binding protein [Byssovorax sp.]
MSSPSQSRTVPVVIVAVLLIAAGIYLLTRPGKPAQPAAQASAAPSAPAPSARPRKVFAQRPPNAAPGPSASGAAEPGSSLHPFTLGALGPKGFADVAEIAKAKKYFEDEGLDVSIDRTKVATDVAQNVNARTVPMGITFDFAIAFQAAKEAHFKVLGQVARADLPVSVFARKDRRIVGPSDLKGKRVAVQPFPNSHYYLSLYLAKHKLKESDVTVVEKTYEQVSGGLIHGDFDVVVDCIATLRGGGWNLMNTPGLDLVDLSEDGMCPIRLGLIAGDEAMKNDPEAIEGVTRALSRAAAYLDKNREKAEAEIAESLAIEASRVHKLTGPLRYGLAFDADFVSALEAESKWFRESHSDVTGGPSLASVLDPDLLRDMEPGAVKLTP